MDHELIGLVLDWVKVDEWLAEHAGKMGRRQIYDAVHSGLLPSVRSGRNLYVPSNLMHVLAYAQVQEREERQAA